MAAGNLVPATVSYDAGTQTATLTPIKSAGEFDRLHGAGRGGATDPRVKDLAGNALASRLQLGVSALLFLRRTAASGTSAATPAVASENDPNAIEVGVKFRSDVAGYITGSASTRAA